MSLREEEEAFMWGKDLLIVPNLNENKPREKALPKGIWREFTLVDEDPRQDINLPVLKIRGGAIIPAGKVIQNTTEKSLDPLTLIVSLDKKGKAEGVLYDDAGEGYAYRTGEYFLIEFKAELNNGVLKVTADRKAGNMAIPDNAAVELITDSGVLRGYGSLKSGIIMNIH